MAEKTGEKEERGTMKAIVYCSKTGFTRKYAQLLAEKTGLPVYSVEEAKQQLLRNEEIFYMGWLKAGSVVGLDRAMDCYTIRGAAIVGMAPNGNGDLWTEAKINGGTSDSGGHVFYLQGGYAPEKLRGMDRLMMKFVTRSVIKQLEAKGSSATEQELAMLELYRNGGDCVREEALAEIVEWIRSGSHEGVLKPVPRVEI